MHFTDRNRYECSSRRAGHPPICVVSPADDCLVSTDTTRMKEPCVHCKKVSSWSISNYAIAVVSPADDCLLSTDPAGKLVTSRYRREKSCRHLRYLAKYVCSPTSNDTVCLKAARVVRPRRDRGIISGWHAGHDPVIILPPAVDGPVGAKTTRMTYANCHL